MGRGQKVLRRNESPTAGQEARRRYQMPRHGCPRNDLLEPRRQLRQKLSSHLGPIFTPGMTDLKHFGLLFTFSKMCPQNIPKIYPENARVKA